MPGVICPNCNKTLEMQASGALFCPFCGGRLPEEGAAASDPVRDKRVSEILRRADEQQDPVKRHKLLTEGLGEYPDSLEINRALLMLGRLHERDSRKLDFSVIKSYLLQMYLEPKTVPEPRKAEFREELFGHPQLIKCLDLARDKDGFLRGYLEDLSGEFIRLFLRGSSVYMRSIMGFTSQSRAPKLLSEPASRMIGNMRQDTLLSYERRTLLQKAFYKAFSRDMGGDTQFLDAALGDIAAQLRNE